MYQPNKYTQQNIDTVTYQQNTYTPMFQLNVLQISVRINYQQRHMYTLHPNTHILYKPSVARHRITFIPNSDIHMYQPQNTDLFIQLRQTQLYQPNRDTHVPTIILSQNTYIFLKLNIDKSMYQHNKYTHVPSDFYIYKPQNTDIFLDLHINSYVPTHQIHTCTNQNTDLFIHRKMDSYVSTKQRHTRTNKSFD